MRCKSQIKCQSAFMLGSDNKGGNNARPTIPPPLSFSNSQQESFSMKNMTWGNVSQRSGLSCAICQASRGIVLTGPWWHSKPQASKIRKKILFCLTLERGLLLSELMPSCRVQYNYLRSLLLSKKCQLFFTIPSNKSPASFNWESKKQEASET